MKPLISIIVPVYKVEKYLPKCLDSILNQTYTNLEIILVDDGSPDACGQICDKYAEKDNRIRVIHKENAGVSEARNTGLDYCNGQYIMFVDSDDYLSQNAVQILYERMCADGSDMAQGNHTDVFENGRTDDGYCQWMKDAVVSGRGLLEMMGKQAHIPVSCWGKLYKREVLAGIRYPSLKCGEDLWVYPEMVEKCKRISLVDQNVYFYVQRQDSVVHQMPENAKYEELNATLHTVQFLLQRGIINSARRWYARGIGKSMFFQDKSKAAELFLSYFNRRERQKLMAKLRPKDYMRWAAIRSPKFDGFYQVMKRICKRG